MDESDKYLEELIDRLRQYYVSREDCRNAAHLIESLFFNKEDFCAGVEVIEIG